MGFSLWNPEWIIEVYPYQKPTGASCGENKMWNRHGSDRKYKHQ